MTSQIYSIFAMIAMTLKNHATSEVGKGSAEWRRTLMTKKAHLHAKISPRDILVTLTTP
uniref:Uncharacterized protein n=1 Tax=Arion vulgaris TaxID=1028688 RepID=A0A0B7AN23_9EUPU